MKEKKSRSYEDKLLSHQEQWMLNYNKILEFIKINNKFPSQYSKDLNESKIAEWCSTQRRAKKGKSTSKMTSERVKFLEKIPIWFWERDIEENWIENYNKVLEFARINKKLPSQYSKDPNEKKIAIWCVRQRQVKRGSSRGKMTSERIKLLENINEWFWGKEI